MYLLDCIVLVFHKVKYVHIFKFGPAHLIISTLHPEIR